MDSELILLSAIAHYEEALRTAEGRIGKLLEHQTDIISARSMVAMTVEKIQEFESQSLLPLARDGILLSDAIGNALG